LNTIGRNEWEFFTDRVINHIEGMVADIIGRSLFNFYWEQQKATLMLEDLVRKSDRPILDLVDRFPRINWII
jgi:hypothetical protein